MSNMFSKALRDLQAIKTDGDNTTDPRKCVNKVGIKASETWFLKGLRTIASTIV